jgi:pyruvate/2-oxoglutarate dehydrogenase complex dihydrolipoamide dehydrogenase (E3) component
VTEPIHDRGASTGADLLPAGDRDEPWTSDELIPPGGASWDLLVVGAGTGGIVAAKTAASFGASVLLVDTTRPGGDCLWTGCVPSKALLAAAHAAADARAAARFGVHVQGVRVDFAEVMTHVRSTIVRVEPDDSPATLRSAGVHVAHAQARFTGRDRAHVTAVDDGESVEVRFRHAVIATGSQPIVPPIPGLADAHPLTSDSIWDLTELPRRLLVLGGGAIGCELGQAFARLGSQVTILEGEPNLLPREDPYAAGLLLAALAEDGIAVGNGARLEAVHTAEGSFLARTDSGSTVPFDRILVAVGRTPITDGLGLGQAGVDTDKRGHVRVDSHLRTTNPRIYAAGDVTGHPQFTHLAGVHGSVAAANAVLGLRRRAETTVVPRVAFTQPEVASVGVNPDHAQRHGLTVRTVCHDELDRARAEDSCRGVTRLVLDRRGRLVGATVVSPRAGESLAELVLAAKRGLRARDLAASVHAYPTYGDGPWKAAIADVQQRLGRRPARVMIRLLAAWRRRG